MEIYCLLAHHVTINQHQRTMNIFVKLLKNSF